MTRYLTLFFIVLLAAACKDNISGIVEPTEDPSDLLPPSQEPFEDDYPYKELPAPEGAVDLCVTCFRKNEQGNLATDEKGREIEYRLFWGKCNIGADQPEDCGDYFAWGETMPYYSSLSPLVWEEGKEKGYSYESYIFAKGDQFHLTKYCSDVSLWGGNGDPDNKLILEQGPDGDDVASKRMQGKWRMPTKYEWEELIKQCEWEWDDVNKGMIVRSRKFKDHSNSIFLPAAGICSQTKAGEYIGFHGYYWSSSGDGNIMANTIMFDSEGTGAGDGIYCRWNGLAVRPVCE